MESLKKFKELNTIDRRNNFWIIINPQTNERVTVTLEDWYKQVKSVELSDKVPKAIRGEFNVARNLAVYSWFCYSFHHVCKNKALGILENILSGKYIEYEKSDLQILLEKAVKDGAVHKGSDALLKEIPKLLSRFRKELAENENYYRNSLFTLKICSELINQLFEPKTSSN